MTDKAVSGLSGFHANHQSARKQLTRLVDVINTLRSDLVTPAIIILSKTTLDHQHLVLAKQGLVLFIDIAEYTHIHARGIVVQRQEGHPAAALGLADTHAHYEPRNRHRGHAGAADQDLSTGNVAAHVAQCVARERGHVQAARIAARLSRSASLPLVIFSSSPA